MGAFGLRPVALDPFNPCQRIKESLVGTLKRRFCRTAVTIRPSQPAAIFRFSSSIAYDTPRTPTNAI
jgi:hypothetical protein